MRPPSACSASVFARHHPNQRLPAFTAKPLVCCCLRHRLHQLQCRLRYYGALTKSPACAVIIVADYAPFGERTRQGREKARREYASLYRTSLCSGVAIFTAMCFTQCKAWVKHPCPSTSSPPSRIHPFFITTGTLTATASLDVSCN